MFEVDFAQASAIVIGGATLVALLYIVRLFAALVKLAHRETTNGGTAEDDDPSTKDLLVGINLKLREHHNWAQQDAVEVRDRLLDKIR